jgi:ParB-like chromosome segregation protein Spo0J
VVVRGGAAIIIIPKLEIKISKYADRVFPLSGVEYEQLKKSIADYGMYVPIAVNQSGDVLDGHHSCGHAKNLE